MPGHKSNDRLTHADRLSPYLGLGLALHYRSAIMAVRRRREHHPFPNGWQLSETVVRCPQVRTCIHPREVGICDFPATDCIGWDRLSVPPRVIVDATGLADFFKSAIAFKDGGVE